MININNFVNIDEIVSRVTDHPMMTNFNKEKAVRYTLEFITKHGFNHLYEDRFADVTIKDFRGILPCGVVRIDQVRDKGSKICFRAMNGSFYQNGEDKEPSFKVQGNVIFTTLKNGVVELAYKGIPLDNDGFPLLIDDDLFLNTLELYIKKKMFTTLFDQGKITKYVLDEVKQDYAFNAGEMTSHFEIPDVNEMESIVRGGSRMIIDDREFDDSFNHLGNREYRKGF